MFKKIGSAPPVVRQSLRIRRDEDGATAVEYALMTGFIAAVIVTMVGILGTQVLALFAMGVASFP